MGRLLLNLTICQVLLIVIGISLNYVSCHGQKRQNVTEYDRSFQKVLSRKRRFLVWRPGSNVLLTASLAKPLAFKKPTGHGLFIEWDIFYPLPSSWKVPKKPAPPKPAVTTELPIQPVESQTPPNEVWQPDGGWTNDVIQQINDNNLKASASRRIDATKNRNWNELNLFNTFQPPQQQQQPLSYKWNPMLNKNNRQQSWRSNDFNQVYPRQAFPSFPQQYSRNSITNYQHRAGRSIINQHESNDVDEDWEHYQAHRDRRDLYERLQSASPLNSEFVKNCLVRMMCEAQHFLHPPGYSLLHDMLRVIFTVPLKDNLKDDYTDAMRKESGSDCYPAYKDKCPINFLAFLLRLKSQ